MPPESHPRQRRPAVYWCECQDCTERWEEPYEGDMLIRCPECRSKNVEVNDPGELT